MKCEMQAWGEVWGIGAGVPVWGAGVEYKCRCRHKVQAQVQAWGCGCWRRQERVCWPALCHRLAGASLFTWDVPLFPGTRCLCFPWGCQGPVARGGRVLELLQGRDSWGCAGDGAGRALKGQDKLFMLCREGEDYRMRYGALQGL